MKIVKCNLLISLTNNKHHNDLSEQPQNYDIIVAIIALVSSAITAAATAIFTRKNEVRLTFRKRTGH
jgi:hypothetical protein